MIHLSRKQTLGLLILCEAVILHATMWPYNFDFRRTFRHNVMFLILAAYAVVLVASTDLSLFLLCSTFAGGMECAQFNKQSYWRADKSF